MDNDLTIGIQFHLDAGWMGGAYYLKNMLCALATLPADRQPRIVVVSNDPNSYEFLAESGYPGLRWATQRQVIDDPAHQDIDLFFPVGLEGVPIPVLAWIPDFQEKHLPHLFSAGEIAVRKAQHETYFKEAGLLLSSESAMRDFQTFYPDAKVPTFVVPFTSFLPDALPTWDAVRATHDLPERYFFAPNQFWMHKNHIVILAALRLLRDRGIKPVMCFSGKELDYRAEGYSDFLRSLIAQWGIADQVRYLGFMPRDDQLTTMRHALAVVQPSKFEGWSTVVEDAKAMNQYLIASSLDVHREQLESNAMFFAPDDYETLAGHLAKHWEKRQPRRKLDYSVNQRRYGERLASVFRILVMANRRWTTAQRNPLLPGQRILPDIEGLDAVTPGSDGDAAVSGRWMTRRQVSIATDRLSDAQPLLVIRLRNYAERQALSLTIGKTEIVPPVSFPDSDLGKPLELTVDLSEHLDAPHILLTARTQSPTDGHRLLVEEIAFAERVSE